MAAPKQRGGAKRGGSAPGKSRGGSPGAKRKKRGRPDPVRSMLIGAGIIAVLSAFFLLPLGGKTLFNRLLDLTGLAGKATDVSPPDATPGAGSSASPGRARPTGAAGSGAQTTPANRAAPPASVGGALAPGTTQRPGTAAGAERAAPLEAVTPKEQAALDDLIDQRTR